MDSGLLDYKNFLGDLIVLTTDSSKIISDSDSKLSKKYIFDSRIRWMSFVPGSVKLQSLLLPASHCSNSHDLKANVFEKTYMRKQSANVADQLRMGIRKVDLRVGGRGLKNENKIGLSYEQIVEACQSKVKKEARLKYLEVGP